MCILFLKAMDKQRQDFTQTLRTLAADFGSRVDQIAQSVIASNERVEEAMRDVLTGLRAPQKNR
jgi:hypothetical protein